MPDSAPHDPNGRLAENIVYFARCLREAGLPVGPASVLDAVAAVEVARIGSREDFYWTLHAIFVKRHEQSVLFEQAFGLFWRKRSLLDKMIAMLSPMAIDASQKPKPKAGAARIADAMLKPPPKTEPPEQKLLELDARLSMSDREILKAKDFAQMNAAEIAAARREMARLRLSADTIRTRRLVPGKGRAVDLRRTLRDAMRNGGQLVDIAFREPAEKHPPIVALCDVSGSMADYSRLFLHFLHAVSEEGRRVHAFVFATRLTNVTRALRAKDPDEALARCSAMVTDWDGGTRISDCLHQFNKEWSRRVLGQGATVLLITDGLERSVDADLAREMDRLHRSCRRLIWLNPLLRFDAFEARAAGITTMLPHVDEFRTIHNLRSMADLVKALGSETGRHAGARTIAPKNWLNKAA